MPDAVHVTRAADVKTSDGQTEGMIRQGAITSSIVSSSTSPLGLCGSVMLATPHSASAVHHHGAQATIVYAVAGHGTIVSDGGRTKQVLAPGDWALIPAYAEHQEVNESAADVRWVIVRAPGGTPVVENLNGWST